tara:strand:+ start:16 stop:705 length:690 start_codon:yes stop_codon:yes gene_type:complete
MKPDNVSRTGTAVFIPLTILALQLTIADKIPVVGYYTLMDNFFLCCFITSMFVSIESGLIYSLITTKSNIVYSFFNKIFNIEKLHEQYILGKVREENKKIKHDNFINRLNEPIVKETRIIKRTNPDNEFNTTINALTQMSQTKSSSENIVMRNLDIEENENDTNLDCNIVDKDIVRVISFDDENLSLSLKQKLVFDKITIIFTFIDNICRVLLPLIFLIYISVIMSYEK